MAQQSKSISDQVNLVGKGTVFEGTLRAQSDVRTSGRIVGRLEVEGKAIVAEEGGIEGEIVATNADIAGTVEGEIYVDGQLVLKSTARVDGDIETDRLVVEEGAIFTGECTMGAEASSTRPQVEVDREPEKRSAAKGKTSSEKSKSGTPSKETGASASAS